MSSSTNSLETKPVVIQPVNMSTRLPNLVLERIIPQQFRRNDDVEEFIVDCERFFTLGEIPEKSRAAMMMALIDKELIADYEKTPAELDYKERLRGAFAKRSTLMEDLQEALRYRKGDDDAAQFETKITNMVKKIFAHELTVENVTKLLMVHCIDSKETKKEIALRKAETKEAMVEVIKAVDEAEKQCQTVNAIRSYKEVIQNGKRDGKLNGGFKRQYPINDRQEQREARECWGCGMRGHLNRDCPKKKKPTCFACGEVGHIRRECPRIKCERCQKNGHKTAECYSRIFSDSRRPGQMMSGYYSRNRNNEGNQNGGRNVWRFNDKRYEPQQRNTRWNEPRYNQVNAMEAESEMGYANNRREDDGQEAGYTAENYRPAHEVENVGVISC